MTPVQPLPSPTAAVADVNAMMERKSSSLLTRVVPPLGMLVVVLGIWYGISYGAMNENRRKVALPPPHKVLSEGIFTWAPKKGLRPILEGMLTTGKVALIGLILATILGMLTAIAMNGGKWVESAVFPYAVIIQTLPILALVPIIKIWFGSGLNSRIIACVLIAFFPIVVNTLFGLKSAERAHHDLFSLHGASRMTRLMKLELPGALPAIFTGLRIAAGGCVIGAIVGDFFFRQGAIGIGRIIDNYQKDNRTTELFAAAAVSSLFGIFIFVVFGVVANRVLRHWHESARGEM